MTTSSSLAIGTVLLDRFEIRKLLGEGGMCCVYLAFDAQRGTELALKQLNSGLLASDKIVQRFQREFTTLRSLSHPGIVTAFEYFEPNDRAPFFTLEFIQGESLEKLCQAEPPSLSVHEVLILLKQVAAALAHVHSHKIVYCDLKPSNIMIRRHTDGVSATLIDFGVTDVEVHQTTTRIKLNNLSGTSLYLSPEQVRGEALDRRSDIYSFGALTYELLSGHVPFEHKELFAITASHLIGKVPSISRYNPNVPKGITRFIEICLAKERTERYQTMEEVTERLDTLMRTVGTTPQRSRFNKMWRSILKLFGVRQKVEQNKAPTLSPE